MSEFRDRNLSSQDLRKLYPPIEAGLDFEMSPEMKERLDRLLGHSAVTYPSLDDTTRIASTIKQFSDITPGVESYDPTKHGKIIRYSNSLDRSRDHKFGLLSQIDVARNGYEVNGLNGLRINVNLLNYYDRERLVHPPFFMGDMQTASLQLLVPLNPKEFRKRRVSLTDEVSALQEDFQGGPIVKGVKTAPSEFYVTDPRVTLPFPPELS